MAELCQKWWKHAAMKAKGCQRWPKVPKSGPKPSKPAQPAGGASGQKTAKVVQMQLKSVLNGQSCFKMDKRDRKRPILVKSSPKSARTQSKVTWPDAVWSGSKKPKEFKTRGKKSTHKVTKKSIQNRSKKTKSGQKPPKVAKSRQSCPKLAKHVQKLPKFAKVANAAQKFAKKSGKNTFFL